MSYDEMTIKKTNVPLTTSLQFCVLDSEGHVFYSPRHNLELLLEVVVEHRVQDGVGHGGGHADQVAEQIGEHHIS